MEETPREYKKRVDETREKRRKIRDKFFEYLQEYELVDERFKAKTRQEILENFEKNETAEKGTELYVKIGQELGSIEIKYQELEELKNILKSKIEEKQEHEKKLREQKFNGVDQTTINIQMNNMKKLETELEKLSKEIEELENDIKNREQEIKEIEELYGKKATKANATHEGEYIAPTQAQPKRKKSEKSEAKTLDEYQKEVDLDLEEHNKLRSEMIQLLKEGIGIDTEIANEIEEEITSRYLKYKEEKEGTLRMKAANFKKNEIDILEELNLDEEVIDTFEIGGKQVVIIKKHGKLRLIRGNECQGYCFDSIDKNSFQVIGGKLLFKGKIGMIEVVTRGGKVCGVECIYSKISKIQEVGGEPMFIGENEYEGKFSIVKGTTSYNLLESYEEHNLCIIEKEGKFFIMENGEIINNEGFDNIKSHSEEIGGKPVFIAKKDGKECMMWGNEQQGDWFDGIYNLQEIGGKPVFIAKKDGKGCMMWGNEQYSDWFDGIYNLQEIGGKPYFKAYTNLKGYIFWGRDKLGERSKDFTKIDCIEEVGGKPVFIKVMNNKKSLMWGTEQQCEWFDDIDCIEEVGGKLCFKAEKDCKQCIIWGTEQQGDWFESIEYAGDIGGKPCFKVGNYGEWCLMRGCEQLGNRFDDLCDIQEIGGKPCFQGRKEGKWCVMWGKEQQGIWFDTIYNCCKEIGGKPCFRAKKHGEWCIIQGNEQMGDRFDYIDDIQEIGGKPAYQARKNRKRCLIWGDKQLCDGFNFVGNPKEIGGKPCFIARKDYEDCIMLGTEQYSDLYDSIDGVSIREIGGKLCFKIRKGQELGIIRGDKQIGNLYHNIYDIQEIGGKPCFHARKNGLYYIIRGNGEIGDIYEYVCDIKDIGGKPCFRVKKNGKQCIIWGEDQQGELFDEIIEIKEIGGKPVFIARKDGILYIGKGQEIKKISKKPSEIKEAGGKLLIKFKEGPIRSMIFENIEDDSQKNQNDEEAETLRDKREKVILDWYQKKLDRDELLKVIETIEDLDKGTIKKIREIILKDFYINYEKDRQNEEFTSADEKYKNVKKIGRKHTQTEKEIKSKSKHIMSETTNIDKRMGEITSKAMDLEKGGLFRRRELKKTKQERDELEKRLNEFLEEARELREQKYNIGIEWINAEKEFGVKKKRKIIKKRKTIEIYDGDDAEKLKDESTLKKYKERYMKMIQEKGEYLNKLIGFIIEMDIGISAQAKNQVINLLKGAIEQKIEQLKQGNDLLEMANKYEDYIENNSVSINKRLETLSLEINEKEKTIKKLEEKEGNVSIDELKKIREEEFKLYEELIKLKDEYKKIKSEWEEKLEKYQGKE